MSTPIAVLGTGSFGTCLAMLAARDHDVKIWSRRQQVAEAINREHRNPHYLSQFELPGHIEATTDLHETLAGGQHLRDMLEKWLGPVLLQAQNLVESGPAAKRWEPEQLPHLVLAMYNIVVGYFAAAPIYRDLDGTDLLSPEALRRQTQFMQRLTELLFSPPDTPEE